MTIAGIDFSTRAVDIVLLDEDTDRAEWYRCELHGQDAFERARSVRAAMFVGFGPARWDDVLAVGIEQPRGRYALVDLARIQGAVLASIPVDKLVQPWNPASWRTAVGLAGNASKNDIAEYALDANPYFGEIGHLAVIPQDACDAYCIALATRSLVQREAA